MAVGTTDTWSASRDEIINLALANLGAIAAGEGAVGDMRTDAARRLDAIVKALDARGQFLWRMSRLTFATTASTAAYTLNATVFDVDAPVSYMQTGGTSRTNLHPMTRDEYMTIADRTVTARVPTRYFIERTLSGAGRELLTMTLYPVPDTSSDTVEYAAAVRAKDFNTGATNADFPTSWILGLSYALTADLAPAYKQPNLVAIYEPRAEREINQQLNADNESQDLTFVPFGGLVY